MTKTSKSNTSKLKKGRIRIGVGGYDIHVVADKWQVHEDGVLILCLDDKVVFRANAHCWSYFRVV